MADRILNVAYIGNGKSANRYHIPYVLDRPDKFRVKSIHARHVDHTAWPAVPGAEYTTDLDAVLSDPEIDVVEVVTPSALHFEYAKRALEAGKHVTVDKPFSATYLEAVELFALAEHKGVTVQCYQNRRFDSDYLTARKVVESGKLGHVFEIVTSYDYYRPHQMEGQALDVVNGIAFGHATHCLDQLISWFGAPDRTHVELRQLQGKGMANDYFDIDLYYDKYDGGRGLKATAHANYMSAFQRPSFEVYGDRGAFIKIEKDQQERDLKHFYLPAGHADFGLDVPEQYGTLRYYDDDGTFHEERVETVRSSYSQWYDALYETIVNGAPQLVSPEETLAQMSVLGEGEWCLS
jgi:predicted dehydrogenase